MDLQNFLVQTPAQIRPVLIKLISLVLLSFEYLHGWSFHSVSLRLLPFFNHPHGEKDSSLDWVRIFFVPNYAHLTPFFPLLTSKSLDPSSQHTPLEGAISSFLSLFKLNSFSFVPFSLHVPSWCTHHELQCPLVLVVICWRCWMSSNVSYMHQFKKKKKIQDQQKVKITSLGLLTILPLIKTGMCLAFFIAKNDCQLIFSLLSARTSEKLLSNGLCRDILRIFCILTSFL